MRCINHCFISALQAAQNHHSSSVRDSATKLLSQSCWGAKGRPAVFQWVQEGTRSAGDPQPGEHLRKLRRRLARLHEVCRLARLGKPIADRLLVRVGWPNNGQQDNLQSWATQEIQTVKAQQKPQEDRARLDRLQKWKTNMNQDSLAKLERWLKGRLNGAHNARLCFQGKFAETRAQATSMVCEHWKAVWAEQKPGLNTAVRTLVEGFGAVENTQWSGLTQQDLEQAVRAAKGSAGPDNWSAEEIQRLLQEAVRLLFSLTQEWENWAFLPSQLREARQITLAKPGKTLPDGTLAVKHTRPI